MADMGVAGTNGYRRAWIAAAVGCLGVGLASAQSDRLEVVVPKDAIPAIDRPEFESVAKAKGLNKNELVIGVIGDREQRAYSTYQLDAHEIVNDVFEGRPIAVTW